MLGSWEARPLLGSKGTGPCCFHSCFWWPVLGALGLGASPAVSALSSHGRPPSLWVPSLPLLSVMRTLVLGLPRSMTHCGPQLPTPAEVLFPNGVHCQALGLGLGQTALEDTMQVTPSLRGLHKPKHLQKFPKTQGNHNVYLEIITLQFESHIYFLKYLSYSVYLVRIEFKNIENYFLKLLNRKSYLKFY